MTIGDAIKKLQKDVMELTKLVIGIRSGSGGGAGTHKILSNTHTDASSGNVVRGDIIIGDSTPKWERLAKGSSGQVLQSDATDVKWDVIPTHASRHQSGGADAVKLDDLATPDDNTDLNASGTKHGLLPKLSGATDEWLRGDGTWQEITSGGSNVAKIWTPDIFASGYDSKCDHFDDASLAAKWIAFQSHAALTATEEETFLKIVDTGNGAATHNIRGYYQTLPSGDFTIVARIGFMPDFSAEQGVGICLFQDAINNPNTCDIYSLMNYEATTTPYVICTHWNQWDTINVNKAQVPVYGESWGQYLRIRHKVISATHTWFFEYSTDALNWQLCYSVTEPWTPDAFGIFINNRTAANTLTAWFDWLTYAGSNIATPPGSIQTFWID